MPDSLLGTLREIWPSISPDGTTFDDDPAASGLLETLLQCDLAGTGEAGQPQQSRDDPELQLAHSVLDEGPPTLPSKIVIPTSDVNEDSLIPLLDDESSTYSSPNGSLSDGLPQLVFETESLTEDGML